MRLFPRRMLFRLITVAGLLMAQNPGLRRTFILTHELSMPGREVRVARVEIDPGLSGGRHTHFGEEINYVIEGEIEALIGDNPPLKVKAGESFMVPYGVKHDARNIGAVTAKLLGTYLVEKDKPFATPAP